MTKASEKVLGLSGIERNLIDLIKSYLDIKRVNYKIIEADPGENVARIKGLSTAIEPGSIMIDKDDRKFIIEKLTKVCGASVRLHERNGTTIDFELNKLGRILFKTYKDKKDLYIYAELEAREPTFGLYIGGGNISIRMKDILKEPSNIPEFDETFEIKCECEEGKLKCKGSAWHWD